MNISYKIILLFALIVLFQDANSQVTKYKKYKFEWDNKLPAFIPVEEKFRNEDAVILLEETKISSGFTKKHLRIKYLTNEGVKKYSEFVLPESFAPPTNYFSKGRSVAKGEFDEMIYFVARIIKPDGSIVNASIVDSIIIKPISYDFFGFINEANYSYFFNIRNISVNDEVEIYYKLKESPSQVYFNGSLPKQNYKLEIEYKFKNLLLYYNIINPVIDASTKNNK